MRDIIIQILEANQDINMASKYAREYLAKEIEKEVKSHVDKIFMEEYELKIKTQADTPF
jgi:flagellar basal body-associated protein FliL